MKQVVCATEVIHITHFAAATKYWNHFMVSVFISCGANTLTTLVLHPQETVDSLTTTIFIT